MRRKRINQVIEPPSHVVVLCEDDGLYHVKQVNAGGSKSHAALCGWQFLGSDEIDIRTFAMYSQAGYTGVCMACTNELRRLNEEKKETNKRRSRG